MGNWETKPNGLGMYWLYNHQTNGIATDRPHLVRVCVPRGGKFEEDCVVVLLEQPEQIWLLSHLQSEFPTNLSWMSANAPCTPASGCGG